MHCHMGRPTDVLLLCAVTSCSWESGFGRVEEEYASRCLFAGWSGQPSGVLSCCVAPLMAARAHLCKVGTLCVLTPDGIVHCHVVRAEVIGGNGEQPSMLHYAVQSPSYEPCSVTSHALCCSALQRRRCGVESMCCTSQHAVKLPENICLISVGSAARSGHRAAAWLRERERRAREVGAHEHGHMSGSLSPACVANLPIA